MSIKSHMSVPSRPAPLISDAVRGHGRSSESIASIESIECIKSSRRGLLRRSVWSATALVILVILGVLVGAGHVIGAGPSGQVQDLAPVEDALAFVRDTSVAYMEFTTTEARGGLDNQQPVVRSRGQLLYTMSGDAFRIESRVRGEGGHALAATFDGAVFRYRDIHQGLETALPGLPSDGNFGPALSNPLLEAVSFVQPLDEDSGNASRVWRSVAAMAIPNPVDGWSGVVVDGRRCLEARFSGAISDDGEYQYRVLVDERHRGWPWRIERVTADGRLLTRSTFDGLDAFAGASETDEEVSLGIATPGVVTCDLFDTQTGLVAHSVVFVLRDMRIGAHAAPFATAEAFAQP